MRETTSWLVLPVLRTATAKQSNFYAGRRLYASRFWAEHSDTAISLAHLGEVLHCLGRFAESESLYLRALPLLEQLLGTEHLEVATCLYDLGVIFLEQGKHTEAELLLQRAYTIREQVLGPEHPGTALCMNELGRLYEDQGGYADATLLKRYALWPCMNSNQGQIIPR